LTIDPTIQSAADAALGHARGAVAAIDPRTGGVLALVSKPYCTADAVASRRSYARCVRSPQQPLRDRALQLVVPPGSSFKIVTLSAALDTHHFGLDTVFSGADVVGPSPYFDNTAYPSNLGGSGLTQLTLAQALAQSDNFTFAHIGLSLGARTLLRYAHRYLIGRQIPFDLPVARSSVADGKLRPTTPELAQSAFGATVDRVTTMQMALIAATVANGGVMMAPHLVQDVEDPSGHVLRRYHDHPLSRVVSRGADQQVTRGMVYVVAHGSGYLAQIPGVEVAGKTGTADSGASKPHAWFVAFAPARHPVVAVAVLNEYSGEGFQYAAPIARKVLMAALRESGHRV
jgi:peptidoglycan glycosyltransferase